VLQITGEERENERAEEGVRETGKERQNTEAKDVEKSEVGNKEKITEANPHTDFHASMLRSLNPPTL